MFILKNKNTKIKEKSMKLTRRTLALLLSVLMLLTSMPLGIFAADANALSYESPIYTDSTLEGYKQYEATWKDSTYVKGDVKYTVYFDTENATSTRDVVFYVINWNGERIGTDSDVDIVTDLIKADASLESGNRWAVVVVDFGGNALAKSPFIESSLALLRAALCDSQKLTVWSDSAHSSTKTVSVHKNHVYVLPAGYRVARDIPYFETDYHASLGTRNSVVSGWNSHIAWNDSLVDSVYKKGTRNPKAVNYAWHTGDASTCSYDHATYKDVECYPGAPQEIDGKVVEYKKTITHTGNKSTCEYPHAELVSTSCTKGSTSNINWAPMVTRYEDLRLANGDPLNYVCRLDIIYPSGEDVEATPVMVQAATQSPRMTNIGTISSKDYDGDGTASIKNRTMLVGFEFMGYTVAVYDYAYSPMSRGDHYGYIDPYSTHGTNGAKTSRAAIRCIRYFAEQFGYNDELIGVAGISKGTPTTAVLSTVNNKYVSEADSHKYDIDGDGPGAAVATRDVWYEGDINADGIVTTESTTVVQPYLTYEAGYNGKHVNGDDVNYDVTRTGEISSEVSVVYCAAGDGINRVYSGDGSIILGGTNPTTGEETQHVPMVLSCGFYDEYGCWNHWPGIQKRFTDYAEYPFIAIGMEDMGHDYPSGIDPMRDYDRYDAYMQFFHSILKPELYTPQVAWMTPVSNAEDVPLVNQIQLQLIKPAESLDAFKAATSVKDPYGNSVAGTWSTNEANTSGLYTFVPDSEYLGGTKYTVTLDAPVVAEKTSRSFTTESAGFLRPVADTYVSVIYKDAVYGTSETLYVDNQRTYLATFKTEDFEGANKAYLNLPLIGEKSQNVSVYLLDGFEVDESATNYNNTPKLNESNLIGTYKVEEGDTKIDLVGLAATAKEEYFTIAVSGSAQDYEETFENYAANSTLKGYNTNNYATTPNAPEADDCYSEYFVWRTGGATGTMTIKEESGNNVAHVISNKDYNRIRWFNTFVRNKSYFDSTDIGKKFDISFKLKVVPASGATSASLKLNYAIDAVGGTLTTYSATPKANTWTTYTKTLTIAENIVLNSGAPSKRGVLSMTLSGTPENTYYFDDIIVKEHAPTELVSRESTSAVTAYITTETTDESGAVADAYVSKAMPDVALGNDANLLLNGGDKENIIFLTYSKKILNGNSDIRLTIPAESDASVEAEIYLLDGYYVNEEFLTYNNMPDLAKAVSLGKFKLGGGINVIDIENAAEKINGAYFTIALKACDTAELVYFNNFESYALGTDVNTYNHNEGDTVTNSSGKLYSYYHNFTAKGKSYLTSLARGGGSFSTIGNVLADPDGSGNQTVNVTLSTSATYGGRMKLYNTITDSLMTADSPLIGQTFRFTAKIKAKDETTVNNKCTAFASAMLTAGSNPITNDFKSNVITATDEWQTVTVDYTVRAKDIKVDTTANGNPAWGYPTFTIDFANTNTSNSYLIDDLTVIKLDSNGNANRLLMASSEGAKKAGDTIGISARSAKDPIADTYVSETDKTGVFGFESTLYADSKRTYFATFKTSDFDTTKVSYFTLPLSGSGNQTLSVYLLDGYKVDENTLCYNNAPAISDGDLIATVDASVGVAKIDLEKLLANIEGDYFTIAVKGSAHYFELNFEDYTSTTTVSEYNINDPDASNPDAVHMFDFTTDVSKLKPLTARRGGDLGTRQIKLVGDNMLFSVTTAATQSHGGYLKLLNTLRDSSDVSLAGKTFCYSIDVKLDGDNSLAETATNQPKITAGIMRTGANEFLSGKTASYDDLKANNNGWVTISGQYTIPASEIGKYMTSQWPPLMRYSYPAFGMYFENLGKANTGSYTYFVDNIAVSEAAPSAIGSLEGNKTRASIATIKDVIADTYVSKGHPNTNYGSESTLRLGDEGGDKKALVLSFANSSLDAKNYVELNLFNSGAAIKDVSVYYVTDLLIDENSVTWNTMPDYEGNLLGKFDFAQGDNKLDLSSLRDKLTGEYFTLILRTEGQSYYEDFEAYDVGTKIIDGTNTLDNNVADADNSSILHYHAFHENVYDASAKTILTRKNGIINSRKIVELDGNKVATAATEKTVNYDGAIKFYNALNDELITKDSDIVGKTFRFTAKVMLNPASSNLNATNFIKVTAGAMTSYSNLYRSATSVAKYDDMNGKWATLTVDYTVSANHIAEKVTASGKTNYSYPIFGLYFGNDTSTAGYNTYYFDDVSVVELIDGKPVCDATFSSIETSHEDIRFVSALDGNVTILETTASTASAGDVISIVEKEATHSILKASGGNLVFGDTLLCDEQGNPITLTEEPVKVVAIYDDTKGTVRFAVGDYLAYYKDSDGNVNATYENLIIDGGVGEKAVFGQSGITATRLNHTTSEILGFQTNQLDQAVRFVSGVDTIYYNEIGFTLESATNTKTVGSTIVYSSVIANDKNIYATDYGYNLMSAISINEIKSGGVVKVTPFVRVGTNYVYGETAFYKISVNGGIKVTEVDESEFGSETNADLASVSVDGEPIVGFSADVLSYSVGASDPLNVNVTATTAEPEATVDIAQNGNTVTITVTGYDKYTKKTYTLTTYEMVETAVVNKNGANAVVTYVFDDGDKDSAKIVTALSEKYPSITGSFALITRYLATLSTIEGDPDDGLLEYEFDEDGNYVYTKNEDNWSFWQKLLNTYTDFEAVNHTHTHAYIGETDEGGSFVYKNTAGDSFTSEVFPIGNVRKEYYASNQILRDLGQPGLVMVGAGLTAGGSMIAYTDSYKALPQTSGAFIGKRTTVNSPKDPASMVNLASDFVSEDGRFNVKAYMVQHYAASATAPKSTSASDYSKDACLKAGVGYWTEYIDKAVEMGEWAAFCFHNVKADTHTGTSGHFVFESQLDSVFSHTENLAKENKVWVASFTDACLYMFERATAEVNAYTDENGNVVVKLDDKENDEIFTMPLTVKVALPEGKTAATANGTALDTFDEGETTCVYVDLLPGTSLTLTVE